MTLTEHNFKDGEVLSSKEELVKEYPCSSKFLENFDEKYIITKNEKGIYKIYLYTSEYEYIIVLCGTYCGGFATVRKRGIKESWDRGHDMSDGKPSKKLFDKLTLEILQNELIYIGTPVFKTLEEVYGKFSECDAVGMTNKNEEDDI